MVRSLFRRLFDGRPIGPRVRQRLEWARLPLPQYTTGTPKITSGGAPDVFLPPNAATVGAAATSHDAATSVAAVLAKLTQNDEVAYVQTYYRLAKERFGSHWRSADILTVLWAAATLIKPRSYLEIGVFRGRSSSVVGATCPECAIYGFDLWISDYYAAPNEGADFVRQELQAAGHTGELTLVSGDSRETVPAFLREHPDLYFDLITVDGDHTLQGAAIDLANVLPRLKVGGIVVFDDLCVAPHLKRLWEAIIKSDARYASWEFTEGGFGVAAGVRMADEPVQASQFDPA